MLDKNKKFRVIEEGVMNQGEMGMTKGGLSICKEKFGNCDMIYTCNPTSYPRYFVCPAHLIVAPCEDAYYSCKKEGVYSN